MLVQLPTQLVARFGITQGGVHDGQEIVTPVRLGQIIVGAGLQAIADLLRGAGRRLHDDRNRGKPGIALDAFEQAHAVKTGHHAVKQDQLERLAGGLQHLPGRFAAIGGVDYEGLSHPQRQSLVHRFEAALRLLDEHCRVYQYLLKRAVGPFVATPCEAPIANEAIQRRAAYLNGRRQDLYDLSLYVV